MDFSVLADHRVKLKENEKKDKYQDLVRELKKKNMEYQSDGDINCNWCSWYSHQRLIKGLEDSEIIVRVETIHTTALVRMARILRYVLET